MVWYGLRTSGGLRCDVVWFDDIRRALVWYGLVWYGLMNPEDFGVVRFGLMTYGGVLCSVVWFGLMTSEEFGGVWCAEVQCGLDW